MFGMLFIIVVCEIFSQYLVFGVVWVGGVVFILFKFIFGIVVVIQLCVVLGIDLGIYVLLFLFGWVDYLLLLFGVLGFFILFCVVCCDWLVVMGVVIVGYLVMCWGGLIFGVILGVLFGFFLGGFLFGVMVNFYVWIMCCLGVVICELGIILLVFGSVGFCSVLYLFECDIVLGMDSGILFIILFILLVVGLLFGDLLVLLC